MKKKWYTYDHIRDLADQFREKYDPNACPVDIESIIEFKLDMEIRAVPGLRSEHDIEAWLSKDMQTIIVDADTYMQDLFHARLRFTLAHEIGHCELHSDFYREAIFKTSEDFIKYRGEMDEGELMWIARHANEFAGRLLVPVEPLYEMV